MDFATKTIHAGQPSEPETGAVVSILPFAVEDFSQRTIVMNSIRSEGVSL